MVRHLLLGLQADAIPNADLFLFIRNQVHPCDRRCYWNLLVSFLCECKGKIILNLSISRYHNGYFRNGNGGEANNNNVNNNNRNVEEEGVQDDDQPASESEETEELEEADDAPTTEQDSEIAAPAAVAAAQIPETSVMSIIKTFVITFITSLLPDTQTL